MQEDAAGRAADMIDREVDGTKSDHRDVDDEDADDV
jgi:hypothetical protein